MIQENDHTLMNLMTAAYSLFKMNIPLEKFPEYCSSMELQTIRFDMEQQDPEGDCPYQFPITFCSPQLGEHYRHRRAAKDFGYFISEALRADQSKRVSASRVFGHAIDEATDKSKQQHLAQCVAYIDNGRVCFEFANILGLPAQDAETIFNVDKNALILLFGGAEARMVSAQHGCSSDGAAVVIGKNTGVAARIKQDQHRAISIHCAAHKQALCGKNASESVHEIGEVWIWASRGISTLDGCLWVHLHHPYAGI